MLQNLQKAFRTAQNEWERRRMPQNTREHLLNVKERLRTIRNLYELLKTYWAENASELSGTFQKHSEPTITSCQNAPECQITPLNIHKRFRRTQNAWEASEHLKTPQNLKNASKRKWVFQNYPESMRKFLNETEDSTWSENAPQP